MYVTLDFGANWHESYNRTLLWSAYLTKTTSRRSVKVIQIYYGYQSELNIGENNPPQLQQPTSFIFLQDRKTIHLHFYKEIQFSDNILA